MSTAPAAQTARITHRTTWLGVGVGVGVGGGVGVGLGLGLGLGLGVALGLGLKLGLRLELRVRLGVGFGLGLGLGLGSADLRHHDLVGGQRADLDQPQRCELAGVHHPQERRRCRVGWRRLRVG